MVKGLQRSLSRAPRGQRDVVKERIDLNGDVVVVAGATGVGFGSVALGTPPEGFFGLMFVQVVDLIITGSGTGHTTTYDGDYGIGTTAASDGTITAADVDVLASTALGAATASVSPTLNTNNATPAIIDNTAGTGGLYLNLLIDDVSISADDVEFTLAGEVWIVYTMIGDN